MDTIVLGLSGGVDSSVAGYLLQQQGYNVVGMFMHNWEEPDHSNRCNAEIDFEDAKKVAEKLKMPYYSVNYAKEYMEKVFSYFLEEYKAGYTPNPDVLCNREIKFGPFLQKALSIGADKIATGHYAKVVEKDNKFYLYKAKDDSKDQSYFLHQLSQYQLSKVIFPLADIEKTEIRQIAKKLDLATATKKDSTGICFIGERNFREFLKEYLPAKSGDICNLQGKKVGTHEGVMYYTLGQRRGLNIGGSKDGNGDRWFVVKKDIIKNILYVNEGECDEMFSKKIIVKDFHFITELPEKKEFEAYVKCRYRQADQKCFVKIVGDDVEIIFDKNQKAVTEGQYAVLYNIDGCCYGGGRIYSKD